MKKQIIFISIILSLTLLGPRVSVRAQSLETQSATAASVSTTYKLPYPGILPDNPLYKLKVVRDKIMLMLIGDPDKKALYHLVLANKQLFMSKLLVDKGNIQLAKETALKGENQMTLMTFVFKNASRTPSPGFLNEIKLATQKHQELLKEMIGKVPKDDAETFSAVLEFSQRNANQLQYLAREINQEPTTTPSAY